jgi:hypothetical protein
MRACLPLTNIQTLFLPGWLAGWLAGWLVGWLADWPDAWAVAVCVNGKARRSMASTRLLKRILEAVGIRQVVGCGAEGAPMTSSVLIK